MSLLMDALKHQASQQPSQPPSQKLGHAALQPEPMAVVSQEPRAERVMPRWLLFAAAGSAILAMGVATGLGVNRWLQPSAAPAAVAVPPVAVAPMPAASPGLILSDLLTKPTSEELEAEQQAAEQAAEQAQLVVSAQAPAADANEQSLDDQVATLTGEQQMQQEFPEGRVLGAGRQMQEADPTSPVASVATSKDYGSPTRELSANEVPQELKDKFQQAIDTVGQEPNQPKVHDYAAPARDIHSLDDVIQRQIPPLRFEAHVYATEPTQRWVKVNGKDLQEGQWITADIQLKEITPQYVLLQTGRQMFSMQALSEWSYRVATKP